MKIEKIFIRTTDGFEIKSDTGTITLGAKPSKLWHLFKILLVHYNKPIHYEQLYEYLDVASTKNIKSLIKNMIYRLRKHLSQLQIYENKFLEIVYTNECYKLIIGSHCHLDLHILNQLNEEVISSYAIVFNNFQNLLPEERYSEWILPIQSIYEQSHVHKIKKIMFHLLEKEQFKDLEILAEYAIRLYPDDEVLSVYLLRSYILQGNRAEAIKYYYALEDRLYEEYGVEPSDRLKEVLDFVNETRVQTSESLIPLDGALVCGMNEFKKIHQLEKRKALRNTNKIICLNVKISSNGGKANKHIDLISSQILKSLRQSDVFAEENIGSYYILLQDIDYQVVKKIENRIVTQVENQFNTEKIQYEIQYIN